jgi:hydroxymethylpyrimidine/phosphomethylpyrimidine kinase
MSADDFQPPLVLTFAASDPTGGAGIQADLMALASMGCHPLSVITAITVQDTTGVEAAFALDADWVSDQARALLEDMPVAAFKIGMLGSVEIIAVIAEIISDYPDIPLVFDPVLASGRGDQLSDEEMVEAMIELLLPQTTILTPNSMEARRLATDHQDDDDDSQPTLAACAHQLLALGCEHVLITGTHENTAQVINVLYGARGQIREDKWDRLPGSYHGSGCTLASAIAANLACGLDIQNAIFEAQEYTWHTLANGFRPGMGQYIPDRFFWARGEDEPESGAGPEEKH